VTVYLYIIFLLSSILSVANKPCMLSIVMQNFAVLNVVMLSVIMLNLMLLKTEADDATQNHIT
jgi:hypothetical protein